MKRDAMKELILKNAEEINTISAAVHETCKNRDTDEQAWSRATERYHESYDRLSFPGGLGQAHELLRKQDPATVETAIVYLEANPYCFRSGYIKEEIARLLKRVVLTDEQKQRLQEVILASVHDKDQRKLRSYARLAAYVADGNFCTSLQQALASADAETARRLKVLHDAVVRK